jgi:hypothetical protein
LAQHPPTRHCAPQRSPPQRRTNLPLPHTQQAAASAASYMLAPFLLSHSILYSSYGIPFYYVHTFIINETAFFFLYRNNAPHMHLISCT